jgi:hypothetical protein
MSVRMSSSGKRVLLGGLAVAALGGAAWQALRPDDSAPPDTAASATAWICVQCGQVIHLTARQRDAWCRSPDRVRHDPDADPRQIVFRCDSCNAFTVCRALQCPVHGTWFARVHPDGSDGHCPQCPPQAGGP